MGVQARNPFENDDPIDGAPEASSVGELLTAIDHVAIAVADLDEALDDYRGTFGATVDHREIIEADGVEVAILRVGGSEVHLLTPTRTAGPLAEFLDEWGPGLHHVGYRVADCRAALDAVIAHGLEVVDDEPRPGLRGATVAVVSLRDLHGTPIQLVER